MNTYLLVGVVYGEFNGKKWANLKLLRRIGVEYGVGWFPVDKDRTKCDYNLAMEIVHDWSTYENKKVTCRCDLDGRIDSCELAG